MRRVVVDGLERLQLTFARDFEKTAAAALRRRGRFIVALPGGSVAAAFLPVLATLALDWTRVEIFWIDERAVPPEHPDSNYGVASRLLLAPARVPASRIHRMHGELSDLEQAARQAADELTSIGGDPPVLDLVLAGVGEDGHVASIFRDAEGEAGPPVAAVHNAPKPPPRRLTLALDVLARAGVVIVAAFGESKAVVMREALEENRATTPAAALLRRAGSSVVLLDRGAGRLLGDGYSLS